MNIQRFITMLLYKLKKKDEDIHLTTIYSLFYDGRYERYTDKQSLLKRLIEIDKEMKWES